MSGDDLHFLRVVIQQLSVYPSRTYRLIVYGDNEQPRHSDFSNAQILVETLAHAIPNFDSSTLSLNPLGEKQGSMVFAEEMKLNETQLDMLGLIRGQNP